MRKIRLLIEYDGTEYSGWQQQPDHPTVQKTILDTLRKILSGDAKGLTGSGRTDAGVHALGQVATFKTENEMDTDTMRRALNAELPGDIAVLKVEDVPFEFHVIRSTVGKLYRYRILNSRNRSALRYDRVWVIHRDLDIQAMQEAAALLVGEHDFTSFMTTGNEVHTAVRNLSQLRVMSADHDEIWIEAYANGFLRGMVRNIVGALVDVGTGQAPANSVPEILAHRDRTKAPRAAPARGLYLVRVDYPNG